MTTLQSLLSKLLSNMAARNLFTRYFLRIFQLGGISVIMGVVTCAFTRDLVYTCVVSIVASSDAYRLTGGKVGKGERWGSCPLFRRGFSRSSLRGILALVRITSGGNIAFGKVSSSLSNLEVDVDHISIYPGLADACSALFGGSPISVVISSTAVHCVRLSEVLMMGIMTAMLLAGW